MNKIFALSHCTNNIRYYLKPLPTTNELIRLKQYFYYQKNLAQHLIKSHRLLTIKYEQKLSSIPSELPNQISNIHQDNTDKPQMKTIVIKIDKCSTLIATGHGIAKSSSSLMMNSSKQLNCGIIEDDISLSKTCKKIFF